MIKDWVSDRGVCSAEYVKPAVDPGRNGRAARSTDPADWSGSQDDQRPAFRPHLFGRRMSDVKPETVEWLWANRIPFGKLTMIAGDPGLGKSFVTLDIAARFSRGTAWPDDRGTPIEPGTVVILSAEDGVADTIRPRLDAAGADVSRITVIDGAKQTQDADGMFFSLQTDIRKLGDFIVQESAKLCIIDPITAFLGDSDDCSNGAIRGLLGPLSSIAEETGCAILCVSHLNKNQASRVIYRVMGSLAFTAAVRASWLVVADRQDEQGRRRLLLPHKNNLGVPIGGLAFKIEAGCVHWFDGSVDIDTDEAMGDGPTTTARDDAKAWLLELLTGGAMESEDIFEQAKAEGISKRTLMRAKSGLPQVRARKRNIDGETRWAWYLKTEETQECHPVPL